MLFEFFHGLLILGAGIDEKWLDRKSGIYVKRLPTFFGKISFSMSRDNNYLNIKVSGDASPKKGFIFKSPFVHKIFHRIKINGKTWHHFTNSEVTFNKLPATITILCK